ncbi:hypothetical protein N7497_003801 [Penicillium chrysogenum]|nr:hypothetical protein N7497_003801 [Penicillium chrysogenum]
MAVINLMIIVTWLHQKKEGEDGLALYELWQSTRHPEHATIIAAKANVREHRDGHGSRIQGRSQSHSRAKTLVEIGIGIGIAVVVGVASLARGRSNAGQQRHGSADSHKDNARRVF